MEFLSWVAIIVGGILCLLFLYWLSRLEGLAVRNERLVFWLGTSILMAFLLIFTLDFLRLLPQRTHADRITNEVVAGKKVWHKYLCIDCHTLLGNGAYYAPDLTKSWDRFLARSGGDEKLAQQVMGAFLRNPPQATHERRGMPRFGIEEGESRALVSFLRWVASIDTNGWPPLPLAPVSTVLPKPLAEGPSPFLPEALIRKGEVLFLSKGCGACHSLGLGPKVGPDLLDVAKRRSLEYLIRWIESPEAIYSELGTKPVNKGFSPMPELGITNTEARAIAVYLQWKGGEKWGS